MTQSREDWLKAWEARWEALGYVAISKEEAAEPGISDFATDEALEASYMQDSTKDLLTALIAMHQPPDPNWPSWSEVAADRARAIPIITRVLEQRGIKTDLG